jgi:hypothetical protein
MIGIPAGTKLWLAAGVTDMRNYAVCPVMPRLREAERSRSRRVKGISFKTEHDHSA